MPAGVKIASMRASPAPLLWNVCTQPRGIATKSPAEAAAYLRDCHVALVGIDSHNIDNTTGNDRPVHTTLLEADILIVEHLCNLHLLPHEGFAFSAVPPKFKGVGTFPVRAMAKVR